MKEALDCATQRIEWFLKNVQSEEVPKSKNASWRGVLGYRIAPPEFERGTRVRLIKDHKSGLRGAGDLEFPLGIEGTVVNVVSDEKVCVRFDGWSYPTPADFSRLGAGTGWSILKDELELI
jgi:hypothetical protein